MISVYALQFESRLYIGSTFNHKRRMRDHLRLLVAGKHHNIHMQRVFDSQPEELVIRILVTFKPAVLEQTVRDSEASLVKLFSQRYSMLNIATVGLSPTKGRKMSDTTRKKCSKNMKERWSNNGSSGDRSVFSTPEFITKMTGINRARANTEEHLSHLKRQALLQGLPERRKASANRMKTAWCDPEFRASIVKSMVRGADNHKSRSVVNLDNGVTFDTVVSAAKSVGRNSASLIEAIQRGGMCGGVHWRYATHD